MTESSQTAFAHKARPSRLRRFLRLVGSSLDPRAYLHALRIVNFYNQTHVRPRRKLRVGQAARISPTATFANPEQIEIGPRCSIGARSYLWAGPSHGRIVLGPDCLIAPGVMMTAANYRFNDGSPINDQPMSEADIILGQDVWVGYGAVVLPGTTIGDGAIIGAGAVVRGTIPARAVITAGGEARQIGTRTLPGVEPAPSVSPAPQAHPSEPVAAILDRLLPTDIRDRADRPLDECGLDSFDLISLRTAIEVETGRTIPDAEWSGLMRLSDIAGLPSLAGGGTTAGQSGPAIPTPVQTPAPIPAPAVTPGHGLRRFQINMPQLALSGLSESWLFKEIGDLHWQMITEVLKSPTTGIADDAGDRLYATFTRIRLDMPDTLRAVRENHDFEIASRLERYGASFFFGHHGLTGSSGAKGQATTMSTFAKYGERGQNTSLVKGTPTIPDPDLLPPLAEFPDFGKDYRQRRSEAPEAVLAELDYEILPSHDINGVGLLYFAAYPTIFDLCLERSEGKGFLLQTSTVSKDICYFANSEPDERLIFRLHRRETLPGDLVEHHASLYRSSDMARMAEVISRKKFAGAMPRG